MHFRRRVPWIYDTFTAARPRLDRKGVNDDLPLILSEANVRPEEHNASRGWQGEYGSSTKT
ncbi:hypothetical protein JI435_425330 [Parastagonospora nodorum SN15]|uniref:Uncharacterized protein n=1 Tax=Phaeosphaeria nodorum (strain SN15 / ATCC MYA-4574 / FGSC 10173) TaxID=321614 RepID=A0A7U2HW74_PHANO|nr:hypothetical protein JI435_425330 [Parastagonospora nodorum SN15]